MTPGEGAPRTPTSCHTYWGSLFGGGFDATGLLWSMNPPPGSRAFSFLGTVNATVTASDQGMSATLLVSRHVMAAGETSRVLTVAHDGFEGHFYEPPAAAKPRPVVITLGGSEGGEATAPIAMALAAEGYPALSVGYFDEAIPVHNVDGPVVAFAGDTDMVWSSGPWAKRIMSELDQAHDRYPHTATVCPDAGHFVDAEPYMPALTAFTENGRAAEAGGTRQADAAAQGDAWQKVLKLLAGL